MMTYNVLMGMLNPTHSLTSILAEWPITWIGYSLSVLTDIFQAVVKGVL